MKNAMFDSIVAAALGAAAMYYFDPDMGRRRRAMLRDQIVGRSHDAERFLRSSVHWTEDRLRGLAAEVRSAANPEEPPSDERISERVRVAIRRAVSTPGAIHIEVAAGTVRLTGHILKAERDRLVAAVAGVDGVEDVSDQLASYDEPGSVPELQGARNV